MVEECLVVKESVYVLKDKVSGDASRADQKHHNGLCVIIWDGIGIRLMYGMIPVEGCRGESEWYFPVNSKSLPCVGIFRDLTNLGS